MPIILGIVFIIMVVMNGALFYMLTTAVSLARKQVDACFLKELEDYGGYLQDREEESRALEEEKQRLQKDIASMEGVILSLKTSPFYAPRPVSRELYVPTARYIDNQFFDNHKLVNDMMKNMDLMQIVKDIRGKYQYQGDMEEYDCARRLLEFLGMNTTYELCTIPPRDQLAFLKQYLTGKEGEFLERFLGELGADEEFDVLNFRTFVREIRTLQDPNMYIRTGEREADYSMEDKYLVHQYDSNISEGLRIIYQNQSFDFSIYRLRSRK